MHLPNYACRPLLGAPTKRCLVLVLLALLIGIGVPANGTGEPVAWGSPSAAEDPAVSELRRRRERAESLDWLANATDQHPWVRPGMNRRDLLSDKHEALAQGDAFRAARASGVLAAEAQLRASRVLDRWLPRVDAETGLLPKGVENQDRVWDYADVAADLYPYLVIAASRLRPSESPGLERVLTSEQGSVDR